MATALQKRVVTLPAAATMPVCGMRASYNGNTLASQARAVGSIPIARSNFLLLPFLLPVHRAVMP